MTAPTALRKIAPAAAKALLDSDTAALVDIREANEHAQEHIAGAALVPLSALDAARLGARRGKAVIFHCLGGTRTAANAARLAEACHACGGIPEVYVLDGGLNAWRAAGLATVAGR